MEAQSLPTALQESAQAYQSFIQQHADLLQDKTILESLLRVFSISQFVAQSCQRDPAMLVDLIASGDLQR
ncbi:MAG: hypothetical protein V3V61_04765, partial [Gammaproteobacteria bacterium]